MGLCILPPIAHNPITIKSSYTDAQPCLVYIDTTKSVCPANSYLRVTMTGANSELTIQHESVNTVQKGQ